MKKALISLSLLLGTVGSYAQSALLPYDADEYQRIQRIEIVSGQFSKYFHTAAGAIPRKDLARFADSFQIQGNPIRFRDFQFLKFIQEDNPEWSPIESGKRKPILWYFYPQKSAMIYHDQGDFSVKVNPILNLWTGRDVARGENLYMNSRGAEVYGQIGRKLGFYTYLTENQTRAPYYLRQWTSYVGAYPSASLTKSFKTDGYDFFQARGYITFSPIKDYVSLQFGHDRNFIGDGYRSFILSDFGKEYLFLKANTKVWMLNYQNLF
ncbi:MAG: hypothetical protein LPK45_02890, partial [Bacteroidota bacterium]|nr:hypothetical protein [Bacteroidota bacterium]MDX5429986.1 hypothetical protein [Bacteroidota bacterium]MDX5468759.1 hypothetical protein [Bacteroidota bacterium]